MIYVNNFLFINDLSIIMSQYFAKEIHRILGVMIRTFILECSEKIFQSIEY